MAVRSFLMLTLHVSKRAKAVIESPIRKFLPFVRLARKRGLTVYQLNAGDPDLAVPPAFFKAVRNYRSKNLPYAPSPGYSVHVAAWLKYYRGFGVKLQPQNILPTVGGAEAILFALQAVADPGDEILVFEPLYVSYKSFAAIAGIKLVPVALEEEKNFALPPARVIEKRISRKTKAIVVVNPDNPTGKLWSEKELGTVLKIARKRGLFVISDETYREIRFSGKPSSLLAVRNARHNLIVVDSVSKRFSMPGARIGCIASFNTGVMDAALKFAQARLSAGTLEQYGLIPLLEHAGKYTKKVRDEYRRRRDVVYRALSAMQGVSCGKPQGAFYIVAKLPVKSTEDFVAFLIRDFSYQGATVLVAPMKDFYVTPGLGEDEVRIAYVLNTATLKKAMEILARGLAAYLAR